MRRALTVLVVFVFTLFAYSVNANAQLDLPAATCGYTTAAPTAVETFCLDGSTVLPDAPDIGSEDYGYIIANADTVIITAQPPGTTVDIAALGFADGDEVYITGFGYSEANIINTLNTVGANPLCGVLLDAATCAALAAQEEADLQSLVDLASSVTGETSTVNSLLGAIDLIAGFEDLLGLTEEVCYSVNSSVDFTAVAGECAPACEATFGTVTAPENTTVCQDEIAEAVIVEGDAGGDYVTVYVITQGADLTIVGLSEFPDVDFFEVPLGDYTVHPLNILADDIPVLLDAVESGAITTGVEAAGAIEAGVVCAALDVTGVVFSVIECAAECDAQVGTVMMPTTTEICNDGSNADVLALGAPDDTNTTDYYYVVTGEEVDSLGNPIIVGLTEDGTFEFPADGTYCYSGLAYSQVDVDALIEQLNPLLPVLSLPPIPAGSSLEDVLDIIGGLLGDLTIPTVVGAIDELLPTLLPDFEFCYAISVEPEFCVTVGECAAECDIFGGELSTDDITEFCTSDGIDDLVTVATTGFGEFYQYLITELDGTILGGPQDSPTFNLEGAPPGECLIWGIAYEGEITVGENAFEITGDCFELSENSISVFRNDELCPSDCEASFGDVTAPENTTVCQNDVSDAVVVEGATEGDYVTVYVITEGADLTIVGLSETAAVDFDGFDLGDYTVHPLNILAADVDLLLDAVTDGVITNGGEAVEAIEAGVVCAALDVAGVVFSVVECADPLVLVEGPDTTVDSEAGTYVAVFTVSGGTPGYTADGGTFDGDLFTSDPITCGTDATFEVIDADGNTLFVEVTAPCEATGDCDASFGTTTAPANTFVCFGETAAAVVVEGATEGDYTTAYVITQGAELTIVGLSFDAAVDFSSYAAGEYTVHPLNILTTDADVLIAAVEAGDITTGVEALDAINAGVVCADLDVAGVVFTVLEELIVEIEPNCIGSTGEADLIVSVSGGIPDPVNGYSIGGTLFGTNTAEAGNPFTIFGITDGEEYTVIITDAAGCSVTVNDINTCTKCPNDVVGTMPTDTLFACSDETVQSLLESFTLDPESDSSFVGYVLHSEPSVSLAGALAYSTSGEFGLPEGGMTNTVYYISGAIGIADEDANGVPDLSDECTIAAEEGTPVVFLDPVTLVLQGDECDNETGLASLIFYVTGGYPAFTGTGLYSITADGTAFATEVGPSFEDLMEYETFTVPNLDDGTAYVITATDNSGIGANCNDSNVEGIISCTKTNVSWLNFSGTVQNDGNLLNWATASEIANDYFTVWSSTDGVTFDELARIDGNGTTSVTNFYTFLDTDATAGITYYYISQTDFDGSTTSTETIALTRNGVQFGIGNVAPVPASDVVRVVVNAATTQSLTYNVHDVTGKLLATALVDVNEGANTIELNVSDYAAGMYLISVSNGTDLATERFVVK